MAAEQVLDSGTLSCVQSKAVFLLAYDEVGTTSANTIIIIHIFLFYGAVSLYTVVKKKKRKKKTEQ